ncbi:unnamed protein product [Arctia plantaginis]|uniref:Uncharacterized protein n=1 Tax=Arctia plantaginis TaxID=874455 RepID=A0A8S1AMU4_ARCPL|nr:unnamed protein product [Arctia plantaginis]
MDKFKEALTEKTPTKNRNVPVVGARYDLKRFPCNKNTYKLDLQCTSNKAEDENNNIIYDVGYEDNNQYDRYVPIKYTTSQQRSKLKLQSSLLQILQQEIPNIRKVPIECTDCKIPHCFDCSRNPSMCSNKTLRSVIENVKDLAIPQKPTANLTRKAELEHERATKWESYIGYIKARKCDCSKMSKKQLFEHLPAYMRKTSNYDAPELPNFEICPVMTLKRLVENVKGHKEFVHTSPEVLSGKKEKATQYSNHELECSCSHFYNGNKYQCFKNNEAVDLRNIKNSLVNCSISGEYIAEDISTFAKHRAMSLRRFIEEAPDVKEIFERK